MTVKLIDIFNTRYLHVDFAKDLNYFLNYYRDVKADTTVVRNNPTVMLGKVIDSVRAGEPLTIDIAEARFVPGTESILRNMQIAGIEVIDSVNSFRAGVLRQNLERIANDKAEKTVLPQYSYQSNIKEYLSALNPEVVYTHNTGMESNLANAIVSLAVALRPSLKFDDTFMYAGLFDYVRMHMSTADIESFSSFIVRSDSGMQILDFSKNGFAFVPGHGNIDIATAVARVDMIPSAFGEEMVFNDERFSTLMNDSFSYVSTYNQKRPKMLYELLEVVRNGGDT